MRLPALVLAALLLPAGAAALADPHVISQRGKRFAPAAVVLAVGDVLHVANDDRVLHHVYIEQPEMTFDSGEQPPGRTVDIRFDRAGDFAVRCAIHPKMKLEVSVR